MINQKGVFLTFMAFLLVSTLLVLNVATKQSEIGLGRNLADKAALKEVDSIFSNIRQQIIVTKEGTASAAYGRFMPFKKFRADSNSIELEQNLPLEGKYLENMYDAINLFAIFAGEKGSQGANLRVWSLLQNNQWNAEETGQYPQITYAVLPQCLLFTASKDAAGGIFDENTVFSKGTAGEECQEAFQASSVASYEIEVRLPDVAMDPMCQFAFAGCSENPDNGSAPYARILLVWENCEPNCETHGFDAEGKKAIAANLSQSGSLADLVEIETGADETVSIRFSQPGSEEKAVLKIGIQSTEEPEASSEFNAKITFNKAIDEIKLLPPGFDFGIRKQGFDYCRATSEEACAFEYESDGEPTGECTTSEECDDSDTCTTDTCTDETCNNTPITACTDSDQCCPTGCTYVNDSDCTDTSLIAHYKFEEGTGTTTADSSGNGNNGILLPDPPNGPTWQTIGCKSGNCLGFDGVNDYVEIVDSPSLSFTAPALTIAAWVYLTQDQTSERPIIRKTNQWQLGIFPADNKIRNLVATTGTTGWTVANDEAYTINAGQLYFFAFTYDGSVLKHYANGVQIGTNKTVTGNITDNSNAVRIGNRSDAANYELAGRVDEARIYNRALNPTEILALYNQ